MQNFTILHVEDEDASAFLFQAALDWAAIPNRIFRVSSGEDALAFLLKAGVYAPAQSPSLVMLDLNLPRIDGWGVLTAMKRQSELKEIPVMILSSSDRELDKNRSLVLGASEYVVKQSTVPALSEALAGAGLFAQIFKRLSALDQFCGCGSGNQPCSPI